MAEVPSQRLRLTVTRVRESEAEAWQEGPPKEVAAGSGGMQVNPSKAKEKEFALIFTPSWF